MIGVVCLFSCDTSDNSLSACINFESIDSIKLYGPLESKTMKGKELMNFLSKYEDATFSNDIGIQEGIEFLDIYKKDVNQSLTGKINGPYISMDINAFDNLSRNISIDTSRVFELVFKLD